MNPKKPRGNCKHCNGELPNTKGIFCRQICQKDYEFKQWIESWLKGEQHGITYGGSTSGHIRRWLIETQGEKCCICGWNEKNPHTGTTPIELDHIDGDYKNNHYSNLRFLCPNHHKLTSTYGSLNRGKGRPYFVQKGERCSAN